MDSRFQLLLKKSGDYLDENEKYQTIHKAIVNLINCLYKTKSLY